MEVVDNQNTRCIIRLIMTPEDGNTIKVLNEYFSLTRRLLNEFGITDINIAPIDTLEASPFHPNWLDPEMATRSLIRTIVLYQNGHFRIDRGEPLNDNNNDSLHLKDTLSLPEKGNGTAHIWSLGKFDHLIDRDTGAISILEEGVVLFSDEVQNLSSGEKVTTLHAKGMEHGYFNEIKEMYLVANDNLYRVITSLTAVN